MEKGTVLVAKRNEYQYNSDKFRIIKGKEYTVVAIDEEDGAIIINDELINGNQYWDILDLFYEKDVH